MDDSHGRPRYQNLLVTIWHDKTSERKTARPTTPPFRCLYNFLGVCFGVSVLRCLLSEVNKVFVGYGVPNPHPNATAFSYAVSSIILPCLSHTVGAHPSRHLISVFPPPARGCV